MSQIITLFQNGPEFAAPAALCALRVATGAFFAISGFNKLFNKGRHATITANLEQNHIPHVEVMQWFVPFWEFTGGAMLSLGLLTSFSASVLFIICAVACCCEAKKRVDGYQPINEGDRIADYLYLPEVLYLAMLLPSMFGNGGALRLDAMF